MPALIPPPGHTPPPHPKPDARNCMQMHGFSENTIFHLPILTPPPTPTPTPLQKSTTRYNSTIHPVPSRRRETKPPPSRFTSSFSHPPFDSH
jgi:hypothetical protein